MNTFTNRSAARVKKSCETSEGASNAKTKRNNEVLLTIEHSVNAHARGSTVSPLQNKSFRSCNDNVTPVPSTPFLPPHIALSSLFPIERYNSRLVVFLVTPHTFNQLEKLS